MPRTHGERKWVNMNRLIWNQPVRAKAGNWIYSGSKGFASTPVLCYVIDLGESIFSGRQLFSGRIEAKGTDSRHWVMWTRLPWPCVDLPPWLTLQTHTHSETLHGTSSLEKPAVICDVGPAWWVGVTVTSQVHCGGHCPSYISANCLKFSLLLLFIPRA